MVVQLPPPPAPLGAGGAPTAPGWSGQQQYPAVPPTPPSARRRRPIGLWLVAGAAAVASVAALALSVVAVVEKSPQTAAPAPTVAAPRPVGPVLFDDDADRALCSALPDLMKERNAADRVYQALAAGSPERIAAMPAFKDGVENWAGRVQVILAEHASPDRYLTRTLQRYVDDKLLYSQNIYPDRPADTFDQDTWNVGVVDYGGALGRCNQLGIRWQ